MVCKLLLPAFKSFIGNSPPPIVGRTEPNLDDLGLAFQDIGVSLVELEDYMNNVGPIKRAYEVPKFPIAHKNDIFSYKADSEDQEPELETTIFEIGGDLLFLSRKCPFDRSSLMLLRPTMFQMKMT